LFILFLSKDGYGVPQNIQHYFNAIEQIFQAFVENPRFFRAGAAACRTKDKPIGPKMPFSLT